jgi:F0F1-type ATP synthase delta subunit
MIKKNQLKAFINDFIQKAEKKKTLLQALESSSELKHHEKLEAFNSSQLYVENFLEKMLEKIEDDRPNQIRKRMLDTIIDSPQRYSAIIKTYNKINEKFLDDKFQPTNLCIGMGLIKRLGREVL